MMSMGYSERHFTKSKMYGPLIKQLIVKVKKPIKIEREFTDSGV